MKKVIVVRKAGLVSQWETTDALSEIMQDVAERYGDVFLSLTVVEVGK